MPANDCKGGWKYPQLESHQVASGSPGTLLISRNKMGTIINLYPCGFGMGILGFFPSGPNNASYC